MSQRPAFVPSLSKERWKSIMPLKKFGTKKIGKETPLSFFHVHSKRSNTRVLSANQSEMARLHPETISFGYREEKFTEQAAMLLLTLFLSVIKFSRKNLRFSLNKDFSVRVLLRFLVIGVLMKYAHQELFRSPKLLAPESLALNHSFFHKYDGLRIHSLVHTPSLNKAPKAQDPGRVPPPPPRPGAAAGRQRWAAAHLCHGFGASALSFEECAPPLAALLGCEVTAHDAPGFGLTQRPTRREFAKYATEFSAAAGLAVLEARRRRQQEQAQASGAAEEAAEPPGKTLFLGHSMGARASVVQALQRPANETVLVLVAPALPPPPVATTAAAAQAGKGRNIIKTAVQRFLRPFVLRLAFIFSNVVLYPLLVLGLRPMVYDNKFWQRSLEKFVWYKPGLVTETTLTRYQWPSLVQEWDRGMARFCLAPLSKSCSSSSTINSSSMYEKLKSHVDKGMQLIIIHGASDKVVPLESSRRLARMHPNIQFEEMEKVGHVPHEEAPVKFNELLRKRLQL